MMANCSQLILSITLLNIREMGKNLVFLDLHSSEFRVQVKAHKNSYKGDFSDVVSKLANGDVIGNWFFNYSSA